MILAEGATSSSSAGIDWVLFWTVVAAVVGALALIGVAFTILQYYRDHPKRRIEWDYSSRKLMAASTGPNTSSCASRCITGTSRNSVGAW